MAREITNTLLEMVENEIIDRDVLINACLKYMSEEEVRDMAELNEFLEHTEVDLHEFESDYGYDEEDYEDEEEEGYY